MGSPLGLQNTVSDGIVSALRNLDNERWIQTTAPVSPGNSGGPLLDLGGKVIGMITASVKLGQNLNFAMPIDRIKPLLKSQSKPVALNRSGTAVRVAVETRVAASEAPAVASSAASSTEQVWTSLTSGHKWKVRTSGDYVYADRADIPEQARTYGEFESFDLHKEGDKWVGKARGLGVSIYYNGQLNYSCHYEVDAEVTTLTSTRIEGRSQGFEGFGPRCSLKNVQWKNFVWILEQ